MREAFLQLIREEKQKGHTVFMSSHIFEEIEAVCDRVAMIKNGQIIDTAVLYDLRHPTVKHFIVEFAGPDQKRQFIDHSGFSIEDRADNSCAVLCKIENLDRLFHTLKEYQVTDLQETHPSLQQQFMSAYKKELTQNGNN